MTEPQAIEATVRAVVSEILDIRGDDGRLSAFVHSITEPGTLADTTGYAPEITFEQKVELLKQLDAHVAVWNRAADGDVVDWDSLYEGYNSAVDFPTAGFYRELGSHYTAAKVVLTLRDPVRWYESVKETILWPLTQPLPDHLSAWQAMLRKAVVHRIFEGNVQDREHVIAAYERHNADVKRTVAAERLLVYDVSEGWPPLCSFLGADIPDEAFPKVNSTEEFRDRILTVFTRQDDAPVNQRPPGTP